MTEPLCRCSASVGLILHASPIRIGRPAKSGRCCMVSGPIPTSRRVGVAVRARAIRACDSLRSAVVSRATSGILRICFFRSSSSSSCRRVTTILLGRPPTGRASVGFARLADSVIGRLGIVAGNESSGFDSATRSGGCSGFTSGVGSCGGVAGSMARVVISWGTSVWGSRAHRGLIGPQSGADHQEYSGETYHDPDRQEDDQRKPTMPCPCQRWQGRQGPKLVRRRGSWKRRFREVGTCTTLGRHGSRASLITGFLIWQPPGGFLSGSGTFLARDRATPRAGR